jgi:putative colanic acid biosysnthesis UDP-glucose lipid carrier transferase
MLYDAEGLHTISEATGLPAAGSSWAAPVVVATRPHLQLAIKRGFDFVAALGLIVFFAPLLIVIAVAIVATDRMPVLYRQQRYGRGGSVFTILKFRTMTVAEPGREFTQATPGDARITRLGAFLRRTSLDELPQLFNVLLGHMSLVGPRPHALVMEEDILTRYPHATRRLDMRPGMTGLAQVRGLRGPTRRKDDIAHRIEADVEYVESWTLRRDLGILAMTPGAWLLGRNAH